MDEEKKTQGEEIPGKAEAEGPAAEDRRTTDTPDVQTATARRVIRSPTNFSQFRSKPRCASPILTTR